MAPLADPSFPWNGILGIRGFAALVLINVAILALRLDRLSAAVTPAD